MCVCVCVCVCVFVCVFNESPYVQLCSHMSLRQTVITITQNPPLSNAPARIALQKQLDLSSYRHTVCYQYHYLGTPFMILLHPTVYIYIYIYIYICNVWVECVYVGGEKCFPCNNVRRGIKSTGLYALFVFTVYLGPPPPPPPCARATIGWLRLYFLQCQGEAMAGTLCKTLWCRTRSPSVWKYRCRLHHTMLIVA